MNGELYMDNTTLVEKCKHGDKVALNLLYTRFAPKMLALIKRYIDDQDYAQDILHDGFIIAFTRIKTIKNAERVDCWLATIMRNLSLKFLKSRDVAQILRELPEIEEPQPVENIINFDILTSLIDSLPKGYQKVFRLAVFENKSHKEISQILGIAPNSSSSQLFRAKIQLRRLIDSHKGRVGLITLLFAITIPSTIEITRISTPDLKPNLISRNGIRLIPSISRINSIGSNNLKNFNFAIPTYINKAKKAVRLSDESTEISDDESGVQSDSLFEFNEYPASVKDNSYIADNDKTNPLDSISVKHEADIPPSVADYPLPVVDKPLNTSWAISLSFNTGMSSQNWIGGNDHMMANNGTLNGGSGNNEHNPDVPMTTPDPDIGTGNDENDREEDKKDQNNTPLMAMKRGGEKKLLKDQPHHNHMPVTFAVTAQKNFNDWSGVETGISYTYLHTTFEDSGFITECHWHYIGIPFKLNLTVLHTPKLGIYGSFGGSLFIPVYSHANEKWATPSLKTGRFSSNPVWSIGAGLGVSLNLNKRIDLYLEPTIQYYFPSKQNVPNLWTDEPWGFTLPIGIRFKW